MKSFIILFVSSFIFFLTSPSIFAQSGSVISPTYATKAEAVKNAKIIANSIIKRNHPVVVSNYDMDCLSTINPEVSVTSFKVNSIWVPTTNGFNQEYQAKISYHISCDCISTP